MAPLERSSMTLPNNKSGNLFTAVAHIFCAVVGAGVLGLPNSLAWLGWVAGPICIAAFFAISLWSSLILTKVYYVDGVEFARYHHAVEHILGHKAAMTLAVFQCLNLVLVCIAYSITGGLAMQTIASIFNSSFNTMWQLVLIMGAMELVLSQVPSLEKIWWVSAMGTASSLGYVCIALILGLVYSGNRMGSVGGRAGSSPADKAFGVLNALGNIAFAYSFALVLLEIQDTLKQPPKAEGTMKKAVNIAVTASFAFYLSTAVAGYSALGDEVPGEVLQGFSGAPEWALVLANLCVVIHMVTAWQVFAQPMYNTMESWVKAYVIKKQHKARAAATAELVTVASSQAAVSKPLKPSPFDVGDRPGNTTLQHQHREVHLQASASGDLERGSSLSGGLAQRMSVRSSGGLVIANSNPIPDMLPAEGWKQNTKSSAAGAGVDASPPSMTKQGSGTAAPPTNLNRTSAISRASSILAALPQTLGSQAMYHLDTGAANEHVPLNDQGYFLPLWQRLAIRSAFVLFCTFVAIIVPFFHAVIGLVGAIMFWPLSIGFPFAMYAKVYKTRGAELKLMKTVSFMMFLVGVAATVASFRSILISWSDFKFFSSP